MLRLIRAALAGCLALTACLPLPPARASSPAAELADGTLLFLENCSSVVEWSTHGDVAHVALLFHDAATPYVYEATPAKVRRLTLAEYQVELARLNRNRAEKNRIRMHALAPREPYDSSEIAAMRTYLDEQLGRRYSVRNYVRSNPADGIHCAELASSTLNASGRYAFPECHKINPQKLYQLVLADHAQPQTIESPALAASDPWAARLRRSTAGWFTWCGWGCREAWLFLW